jgi:hypothetical protein
MLRVGLPVGLMYAEFSMNNETGHLLSWIAKLRNQLLTKRGYSFAGPVE